MITASYRNVAVYSGVYSIHLQSLHMEETLQHILKAYNSLLPPRNAVE